MSTTMQTFTNVEFVAVRRDPHPQKRIRDPRTWRLVEVDAGIAPLLKAMWRVGIHTKYSCEGIDEYIERGYGDAYISFEGSFDYERFFMMLERCSDDELFRVSVALAYEGGGDLFTWESHPGRRGQAWALKYVVRFPKRYLAPLTQVFEDWKAKGPGTGVAAKRYEKKLEERSAAAKERRRLGKS